MFCERINGNVTAIGVTLDIAVILAKWHAANTKCSQHQLSIPFGYRQFWQRFAFSLRIGEDTFCLPKADYDGLGLGIVLVLLSKDRRDNLIGFTACNPPAPERIPALHTCYRPTRAV